MPKYDLAGNPLPENTGTAAPTDLAGNPIPIVPAQPPAPAGTIGFVPPPAPGNYTPISSGHTAVGSTQRKSPALGIVLGIVSFVIAFLVAHALVPHHTAPPASFTTYTAPDKSYSCDAPADWAVVSAESIHGQDKSDMDVGSGPSTVGGVLFKQGNAKIELVTDRVGSLIASSLLNSKDPVPEALTGSRVDVLHKNAKKRVAWMKDFVKQPTQSFDGPLGSSRVTEWTADGGLFGGGHLHGYYASMVGGDLTVIVVCQCREDDWGSLKPAFQRVIGSITNPGASQNPALGQ